MCVCGVGFAWDNVNRGGGVDGLANHCTDVDFVDSISSGECGVV